MAVRLPCAQQLNSLLSYDEDAGALRWRVRVNQGVRAGDIAGKLHKGHRYLRVKIKGQEYAVHRLVWKMKTGAEPPDVIDHIDCNPLNNRWSNLRAATSFLNMRNRKMQKNNTSGIKGVHWNKADERWKASITVDGKQIYLGYFQKKDDAAAAVNAVRPLLHGDFARSA